MSNFRWQCEYVDHKGKRCEFQALWRLHFAWLHPFDHVDVCRKHLIEYHHPNRTEELENVLPQPK